jgi:3-hydroxymyristoyl/3-hydroxydecanoyl-(acyl carrier protein) dehydratase
MVMRDGAAPSAPAEGPSGSPPHVWPAVLQVEQLGNAWRFRLRVPPDSDLFLGHFPQLPVLAGVAQLHWALALYREHSGDARPLRSLRRLKFQRIVTPGDELLLDCRPDAAERVTFTFSRALEGGGTETVSNGQCLLAHADA